MQEFAPSDEEFAALRAGEEWDPEKARLKAEKVRGLNSVERLEVNSYINDDFWGSLAVDQAVTESNV